MVFAITGPREPKILTTPLWGGSQKFLFKLFNDFFIGRPRVEGFYIEIQILNRPHITVLTFGIIPWAVDNTVGVVTRLQAEESWFDSRQGKIFICPPKRPGSTQPFIQWLAGLFPRGYSGQVVKLTTHFNILPNVRMSGAIPPLPHVLSWYAQGQLYLYVARFQASAAL